eukprot:COSAG01_NODE_957_length_12474_cov_44.298182_2_plen_156_part_00
MDGARQSPAVRTAYRILRVQAQLVVPVAHSLRRYRYLNFVCYRFSLGAALAELALGAICLIISANTANNKVPVAVQLIVGVLCVLLILAPIAYKWHLDRHASLPEAEVDTESANVRAQTDKERLCTFERLLVARMTLTTACILMKCTGTRRHQDH